MYDHNLSNYDVCMHDHDHNRACTFFRYTGMHELICIVEIDRYNLTCTIKLRSIPVRIKKKHTCKLTCTCAF